MCTNPGKADIVFVLDTSGSIGQPNWYKMLNFVKSMALALRVDSGVHNIGVATFGSHAYREIDLDNNRGMSQLLPMIDK